MKYFTNLFLLAIVCVFFSTSSVQGQRDGLDDARFYEKSWAVVIGINSYQQFPDLEYAVNDARSMSARLQRMGFQVISLLDGDATKNKILDVLQQQIPQQVGKNDRLVIFYAGHGAAGVLPSGEEVGFIIPADGSSEIDGKPLEIIGGRIEIDEYKSFAEKANFLSVDAIRDTSDAAPAKHVFYIIDGCYSGFLDPAVYAGGLRTDRRMETAVLEGGAEGARALDIATGEEVKKAGTSTNSRSQTGGSTEYLDLLTSRETVQILSAGSSGEQVYEKGGHGTFTYYLLRALDGVADLNNDCVIRASELGTYLKQAVPDASDFSQTPLFNRISGEGEFIFIPPICRPIAPVDLQAPQADKHWAGTDAYSGPKRSKYKRPAQVLPDSRDHLYVLDSGRSRIFKFDELGQMLTDDFDPAGREILGKGHVPVGMAIGYGDQLWVFYTQPKQKSQAGKIVIYNSDGSLAETWNHTKEALSGCLASDGSSQDFPAKALIGLDGEDNLILVDQEQGTMRKCDRKGALLQQWGGDARGSKSYKAVTHPQGVAVDMFGYIYVTDTEGHGIQKFFDGEWIPGQWANVKGNKPFFFNTPRGIAVDGNLYVYVADSKNHRIKKYTSGGEKLMAYWGKEKAKKGKKYGEFNEPSAVAVSVDSSKIYVADTGNKRIQRFLIER